MSDPVVIVDYDPAWPARFEVEKARLVKVLTGRDARIEHIGSTAVPGLAAKPVIDIMIGLPTLAEADACVGAVQGLGYAYVPEFEAVMPDRRYFRNGIPRTHQIHMVARDSDFWLRHLLFRDFLRAHPATAQAYAELKRELSRRYRDDREAYTAAKGDFIGGVLSRAGAP